MAEQKKFAYTARNAQGEIATGVITADSETSAARRLQVMGLAPLSLRRSEKAPGPGLLATNVKFRRRVKAKHLAMFSRQFATMIDAGLPLVRSLSALAEQSDHSEMREILPKLRTDIEAGMALSAAMSKYRNVFPTLMISLIAAGEVAGNLGETFNRIADTYEKDAKLRSKIVSAMSYPVVVLIIAVVLVTGMMIFIVPKFEQIFDQLGGELPLPTRILIMVSHSMAIIVPVTTAAIIGITVYYRQHRDDRRIRQIIDPTRLRIPIVGKFIQKISIARFSRTLASLLGSGVPMLQALEIVSGTAGNIVISDAMEEVRAAVRSGKTINSTLSEHPVFPPLVVQMVATGEETGALPHMLDKIAEYFERDVESTSESLSSLIEPLLLVFLSVIVGGIVLGLYLPIFQVFSLINK